MDNLYLCVKNKDDKFIPFFIVQGSFFSKNSQKNNEISGGSRTSNEILGGSRTSNDIETSNDTVTSDNLVGGAASISLDEILQHVNYKEVLENDKLKDNQPVLENDLKGGKIEIEISNKDTVFESALPEDFKKYLNYKLNK